MKMRVYIYLCVYAIVIKTTKQVHTALRAVEVGGRRDRTPPSPDLTLSQPVGADYDHHITSPQIFTPSHGPAAWLREDF